MWIRQKEARFFFKKTRTNIKYFIFGLSGLFAPFLEQHTLVVNDFFYRNDLYKIFGGLQSDLPNLEKVDGDVVLIPLHNDLSESDIDRIISNTKLYDKI